MEFGYLDLKGTRYFRTIVEFDLDTEAEMLATFKRAAMSFRNTVVSGDKKHPLFRDNTVVVLGEVGVERVELAIKQQNKLDRLQRLALLAHKAEKIEVNPKYL